jgi:hypothetical protein
LAHCCKATLALGLHHLRSNVRTMKISRPLFFLFVWTVSLYRLGGGGDRVADQLAFKLVASASEILPDASSAAESAAAADDDDPSGRTRGDKSGGRGKIDLEVCLDDSDGVETVEAAEAGEVKDFGSPDVPRLPRAGASNRRTDGPLGVQSGGWRKIDGDIALGGSEEVEAVEATAAAERGSPGKPRIIGSDASTQRIKSAATMLASIYVSYPHVRANYEAIVKPVKDSAPRGLWDRLRKLALVVCGRALRSNHYPISCVRVHSLTIRETCHWSKEELDSAVREVLRAGEEGGDGIMLERCKSTSSRRAQVSAVGVHPAKSFDVDQLPHGTLESLRCF